MAGPWFTVQKDGEGFEELDRVFLSDGKKEERVSVQIKLVLEEMNDDEA